MICNCIQTVKRDDRSVMKKKNKLLALGGITAALTFVMCWVGSVSAGGKFIMPAVCGIFLMILARLIPAGAAFGVYSVSCVLLLLLPNRVSAFAYILLLGYYPTMCQALKKAPLWLRPPVKLGVLTAAGCIAFFGGAGVLGLWQNPNFLQHYPLLILAYYVIAGVYELFLWSLRRRFEDGWDDKMKKLLNL